MRAAVRLLVLLLVAASLSTVGADRSAAAPVSGTVDVVVRTPDGAPVMGRLVLWRWDETARRFQVVARERVVEEGALRRTFGDLEDGRYVVSFTDRDQTYWEAWGPGVRTRPTRPQGDGTFRVADGTTHTVRLRLKAIPWVPVTARLVDDEGERIDYVPAYWEPLSGEGLSGYEYGENGRLDFRVVADSRYRLTIAEHPLLFDRYLPTTLEFTARGASVDLGRVVIETEPYLTLRVRVVDERGVPVRDASVSTRIVRGDACDVEGRILDAYGDTDADGVVDLRVPAYGDGGGCVHLRGEAWAHAHRQHGEVLHDEPTLVRVTEPFAELEEPLVIERRAVVGGVVTGRGHPSRGSVRLVAVTTDGSREVAATYPDARGRYGFTVRRNGRYTIRFLGNSGLQDETYPGNVPAPEQPGDAGTFRVTSEPTVRRIDQRIRRVPAVILRAIVEQPLPDYRSGSATLIAWDEARQRFGGDDFTSSSSFLDGRLYLDMPPPGTPYLLVVDTSDLFHQAARVGWTSLPTRPEGPGVFTAVAHDVDIGDVVVPLVEIESRTRARPVTRGGADALKIRVSTPGALVERSRRGAVLVRGGPGKVWTRTTVGRRGLAVVRVPTSVRRGRHRVVVIYLGNDEVLGSRVALSIKVR